VSSIPLEEKGRRETKEISQEGEKKKGKREACLKRRKVTSLTFDPGYKPEERIVFHTQQRGATEEGGKKKGGETGAIALLNSLKGKKKGRFSDPSVAKRGGEGRPFSIYWNSGGLRRKEGTSGAQVFPPRLN